MVGPVRFELTRRNVPVLQTGAFNHSATNPKNIMVGDRRFELLSLLDNCF